jgi:hypothetical protein
MKNRHAAIVALAICLCLLSCGTPVPPDKIEYVGEWTGQGMYLLILQDGSVEYRRLKGGGTREVTGPIQAFEGDDFKVGISFISTTFHVSRRPYLEGGVWKMVVDGVELTKSG